MCRSFLIARAGPGLHGMARDFSALRAVFSEMTALVGQQRSAIGGPLPASCSISLKTKSGVAAMPALLAVDCRSFGQSQGGAKAGNELKPLLAECVDMVAAMLTKATGQEIALSEAPKREAGRKGVERLCTDLEKLAGILEGTFAEAQEQDWTPSAAEQRLLENSLVIVQLVTLVDQAVQAVAGHERAPIYDWQTIPQGKRLNWDVAAAHEQREQWLQDLAVGALSAAKH